MKLATAIIAALWIALVIQFPAETRLVLAAAVHMLQTWGLLLAVVVAVGGLWLARKAVSA